MPLPVDEREDIRECFIRDCDCSSSCCHLAGGFLAEIGWSSSFPTVRPWSLWCFLVSSVYFRKSHPVVIPNRKNTLATIFGNAYGNRLKKLLFPNCLGNFAAGFAKAPPKPGPKIDPITQTNGMTEKAFGCSSLYGTISATVVRRIPTLPLLAPAKLRATMVQANDLEKPNSRLVLMAQNTVKSGDQHRVRREQHIGWKFLRNWEYHQYSKEMW